MLHFPPFDSLRSIYVGYNGWWQPMRIRLPATAAGDRWHRVADTSAWMQDDSNFKRPGEEERLDRSNYEIKGRAILVLIEK